MEFLKSNSNSNSREEKSKPENNEISRRKFLKIALTAMASSLLPDSGFLLSSVEASELKENNNWQEGVKALLKDVFESEVETSGVFVQTKNGKGCWVNIQDGDISKILISSKEVLKEIQNLKLNHEISKIIVLHSHPLNSAASFDSKWKESIHHFKKSKNKKGIILPPSDVDMGTRAGSSIKYEEWRKVFGEAGFDYRIIKHGVVEPSGVWFYRIINPNDLSEESPFRKYFLKKKEIEDEWEILIESKLKDKIKKKSLQDLKDILKKNLEEGPIKKYLEDKDPIDRNVVEMIFKGALSYNEKLIRFFIEDEEDLRLALENKEIEDKTREIDENFKEAFGSILKKSKNGKAELKDVEKLKEMAYWKGIDLSFYPHSQEVLNEVLGE
jgi:hypothetical protein